MGWFEAAYCIRQKDFKGLADVLKGEMDPLRTLLVACREIATEMAYGAPEEGEALARFIMERALAGARSEGWRG